MLFPGADLQFSGICGGPSEFPALFRRRAIRLVAGAAAARRRLAAIAGQRAESSRVPCESEAGFHAVRAKRPATVAPNGHEASAPSPPKLAGGTEETVRDFAQPRVARRVARGGVTRGPEILRRSLLASELERKIPH